MGITQDPETLKYMIVMEYMELGSLKSNLMIKNAIQLIQLIQLMNIIIYFG